MLPASCNNRPARVLETGRGNQPFRVGFGDLAVTAARRQSHALTSDSPLPGIFVRKIGELHGEDDLTFEICQTIRQVTAFSTVLTRCAMESAPGAPGLFMESGLLLVFSRYKGRWAGDLGSPQRASLHDALRLIRDDLRHP